ncbi:MAG: VCBS repeat-containing protein [Crocinitomicaceae bacterium]|nr:VCBS repeat-containing protein [Crocinitomicaceae bacterium]
MDRHNSTNTHCDTAYIGWSVGTRRFDQDGDNDLLATSLQIPSQVLWWENLGSGNFSAANIFSGTIDYPAGLSCADLDNDGDADVLTCGDQDDQVIWFENTGLALSAGASNCYRGSKCSTRLCW